jgi:streptogramin lyase
MWFTNEKLPVIGSIMPSGVIKEFRIRTSGSLGGITTGSDSNLGFAGVNGNRIDRMTTAAVIGFPVLTASSGLAGVTRGPDRNIWFAESTSAKIGVMTTSGVVTEFSTPTAGAWLHGINAGPDGNVWFVEIHVGKIARIASAGKISEFSIPTSGSNPRVIATGADGNLWFSEFAGNKIGRATSAGRITEFRLPGASSSPVGIAEGPDGNIWFTEQASDRIGEITPSGVITEFTIPTASALLDKIALRADGTSGSPSVVPTRSARSCPVLPSLPHPRTKSLRASPEQRHRARSCPRARAHGLVSLIPRSPIDGWRCASNGANCSAISGATAAAYTAGAADVSSTIEVIVTATNSSGSTTAIPAPTTDVSRKIPAPALTGTPSQRQTLTASRGAWSGNPTPAISYQWQDCNPNGQNCTAIPGGTGPTYAPGSTDVGSIIDVIVTRLTAPGRRWRSPPPPP